jgi:hypothetical protein
LALFDLLKQPLPFLLGLFNQRNGRIEMHHVICASHGVAPFAEKRIMRKLVPRIGAG